MNTTFTAKSTFAEGLVMDFAPDNTQATTLTSALNATLLTFNGNEMSLLNDMGNGRVETAYLPEGYVPVGTCEFGDIIYIVSYNPLLNKSLIGCFPSPERNMSSLEMGGLDLSLKWTDFLKSDGAGPTGELVASSVKKVLYKNKDMTSGDKYIIYSNEIDLEGKYLSDYGNTSHLHGRFPKFVKVHVVSIEQSGKITYLDSSTKWYKLNNFYIQNQKEILDKPDLDSYRTMVSSAYSIFSSKVSGQLALLIELEKISGFSCTWSAYTKQLPYDGDILSNNYLIYWNFSWETDDFNTNPSAVVLTKSEWTGENNTLAGCYQTWGYDDTRRGWVLGGKNQEWLGISITPPAYPNSNYYYSKVSRVYEPETYSENFDTFIKQDSYYAKSKARLNDVKRKLGLLNVELIKVNLSRDTEGIPEGNPEGTPDEGKYYFNCFSSSTKDGKVKYYTNYENELKAISSKEMSDDIINNTFSYPITKKFTDFIIPIKQKIVQDNREEEKNININNLIYYYELTPAMPYGLLREFSLDGYIDFKKIGTKSIKLNTWKYHNYENTSTLTWGLEAYTEPNKGISEVVFIFYDNLGPAAAYHSTGKSSYNGKFTEYFTLNTSGTNYKLNNKNENSKVFYHKGEKISKEAAVVSGIYLDSDGVPITIENMTDGQEYYVNDAGTLYSNCLYLVKIIVKYCNVGALGDYIEDATSYVEEYRWYWTNTMFNNYYYSVLDFKDLLFSLNLNCESVFETVLSRWEIKKSNYITNDSYEEAISGLDAYKSLSAIVQHINLDNTQNDNLRMAVRAGLLYNYNTFNIEKLLLNNIDTRIFLSGDSLLNYPELPTIKFSELSTVSFDGIYPTLAEVLTGSVDNTTSNTLNTLVESSIVGIGEELYNSPEAYKNYTNNFNLFSTKVSDKIGNAGSLLIYINSTTGEEVTTSNFTVYNTTLDKVLYNEDSSKIDENKSYPLTLKGIHYSKYYYNNKLDSSPIRKLKSFVSTTEDLDSYALGVNNNNLIQYNRMFLCSNRVKTGAKDSYLSYIVSFDGNTASKIIHAGGRRVGDDSVLLDIHMILSENYEAINKNFKFMFPQGFGNNGDGDDWSQAERGKEVISSNRRISTGSYYSNKDLGGTLVGITNKGVLEPGDHMGQHNSLTEYIPIVLGYLTQLYYLTPDPLESIWYYPFNYVYLDQNYSLYTKDVVIELTPKANINNNDLLVFNGWKYSNYLEAILDKANIIKEAKLLLLKEKNVLLKLHGCLKTCPLLLKVPYIIPDMDITNIKNKTIVDTIYSDVPKLSKQSFTEGSIYYYDTINNLFANVASASKLRKLDNYAILSLKILSTLLTNTQLFDISMLKRYLTTSDNYLTLTQTPPPSPNTYTVKTCNNGRGHHTAYLTLYYWGLNYYKL